MIISRDPIDNLIDKIIPLFYNYLNTFSQPLRDYHLHLNHYQSYSLSTKSRKDKKISFSATYYHLDTFECYTYAWLLMIVKYYGCDNQRQQSTSKGLTVTHLCCFQFEGFTLRSGINSNISTLLLRKR